MRRPRGFTLIEILIALAILSVPVLSVANLSRSNHAGVHHLEDRLTSRMARVDLAGVLAGETKERLDRLNGAPSAELDFFLEARVAGLPLELRDRYQAQIQDLRGKITFSVQENHGGVAGVCRYELRASLSRGAIARTVWYLRPGRRIGIPPAGNRP